MIRVSDLKLAFPGFSLGPVSLEVPRGGFYALMGPTGSGKTLVLESIAGLVPGGRGTVEVNGVDVSRLEPEKRRIGIVYQDHALFPHLTVLQNVTYGQRYHGIGRTEGRDFALSLMESLRIDHLAGRRPATLSGGERQRTSIARALACRPDVLLLDEPLSSLDPRFREGLRETLKKIHRDSGVTFLMVTHDFADALALADRAAVLKDGTILQAGSVTDIFSRPSSPFVAEFVGVGNIFDAAYENGTCRFCGLTLPQPSANGHRRGHIALRTEDIAVSPDSSFPNGYAVFPGILETMGHEGFMVTGRIRCGEARFTAPLDTRLLAAGLQEGDPVFIGFSNDSVHHITE